MEEMFVELDKGSVHEDTSSFEPVNRKLAEQVRRAGSMPQRLSEIIENDDGKYTIISNMGGPDWNIGENWKILKESGECMILKNMNDEIPATSGKFAIVFPDEVIPYRNRSGLRLWWRYGRREKTSKPSRLPDEVPSADDATEPNVPAADDLSLSELEDVFEISPHDHLTPGQTLTQMEYVHPKYKIRKAGGESFSKYSFISKGGTVVDMESGKEYSISEAPVDEKQLRNAIQKCQNYEKTFRHKAFADWARQNGFEAERSFPGKVVLRNKVVDESVFEAAFTILGSDYYVGKNHRTFSLNSAAC